MTDGNGAQRGDGYQITRPELVWPGKYDEGGRRREPPRANLPFQVIERVNESRATREARKQPQSFSLFETYQGDEGETFEEGWRNKLIWGDNLPVMSSLLEQFAGKVDLIYIDPPFLSGADFSFRASVGEDSVEKKASLLEEKAYRDTWGRGAASFVEMLYDRFQLMRELLAHDGLIFVHMGWGISHYVKIALDEVFGRERFINQIIWRRQTAHSDITQGSKHLGRIHDVIFLYSKSESFHWNMQYTDYSEDYVRDFYKHIEADTGRRYRLSDTTGPGGAAKGNPHYEFLGVTRYWRFSRERMEQLYQEGRIVQTKPGTVPAQKRYLDEMPGVPLQDLWLDIPTVQPQSHERIGYDTQKPEALLDRVIKLASEPGDLVADFFSGSGTTMAVAEKLGRRWIGTDLGRWGLHVSRKRLLDIPDCKPFEVLNLGRYERQFWQGATFGGGRQDITEQTIYEYLAFVLKLYGAQPISGMERLHGKKGSALIHVGAVDAPVTVSEVSNALKECADVGQKELHVLGWEWEMGLAGPNNDYRKGGLMQEEAKRRGVKLMLKQIPREVMEEQAVDRGDVRFFELAYLEADIQHSGDQKAQVALNDFVIPNTDLIPEEVREKITKWSDYIDYWAVDWDFKNDSFMQGWVAYRTRKDRSLPLASDTYTYEGPGTYRVAVKVIDVFGNDTTQAYEVEVG